MRLRDLNKERKAILSDLYNQKARFITAADDAGTPHFSNQPHTDFFEPFRLGIRLSYVMPTGERNSNEILLNDDNDVNTSIFDGPIEKYKEVINTQFGNAAWTSNVLGKQKTFKTPELYTDVEAKVTKIKKIYKVPIAEVSRKFSDIFGVTDAEIPVNVSSKFDFKQLYKECINLKEGMIGAKGASNDGGNYSDSTIYRILTEFSCPIGDLSAVAAIGIHNTSLNAAGTDLYTMFSDTKRCIVDFINYYGTTFGDWTHNFSQPPFEQTNAFTTSDGIDAQGIARILILQTAPMIVKSLAEMTDPKVAKAKLIKDTTYFAATTAIKMAGNLTGKDDDAKELLKHPIVRLARSSFPMFALIPAMMPPDYFITPLGIAYWVLSPTTLLDPIDKLIFSMDKFNGCKD